MLITTIAHTMMLKKKKVKVKNHCPASALSMTGISVLDRESMAARK